MISDGEIMQNDLRKLRTNLKLTQEQISLLTGVPIKTLRNWEQEVRKPSDWTLDLVMDRLLRVKMEEIARVDETTGILSFLTIKDQVREVAGLFDIAKMTLFGSYALGTAREDSDIDLYMESPLFELDYFGFIEALRMKLHKKIGLLSNRTVLPLSAIDLEIQETGIVIYER